ncbi:MAG: hypothetical protein JSV78_12180 [Phycisphaerales bacterium]|nr:MAG: hypothetical protein JSV78_12180 [Phycisphaerales bacterium]
MKQPAVSEPLSDQAGAEVLGDVLVVASFKPLLLANELDSLEALFAISSGESLGKPGLESWRERIRLSLREAEGTRTVYLKRFTDPPPKVQRAVRASDTGAVSVAGLEWARMHQLARDGITTIMPIAFGEEIRSGREVRSAILAAAVPGESLERLAANWSRDVHLPLIRRALIGTADLVACFHGCGYIHRDLYLSHIFFDEAAASDEALHLIDLQRVIRPRWRRARWIVKDLASLNYSTPFDLVTTVDRLRWLRRYLNVDRLDGRAKRLVRRIMAKTARIARHDRQRKARWRAEGTGR